MHVKQIARYGYVYMTYPVPRMSIVYTICMVWDPYVIIYTLRCVVVRSAV